MAHRYGRLPHQVVPGIRPGSWSALLVDIAVYRAGEDARVQAAGKEGAMIFVTWGL